MVFPTNISTQVPRHLDLGWHVRERILPRLARIDGLQAELPRTLEMHDLLVGQDLHFDLRQGPRFASNLCENNSALELAYTFGGRDSCGLRYSYEPTAAPGVLHNRYTLFRDRLTQVMHHTGNQHHLPMFEKAYRIAVPRELTRGDTTITIAAVHHYRDRSPRVKTYFSCDHEDPRRARDVALQLVQLLDDRAMLAQWQAFVRQYRPLGGMRMVGLDFEPNQKPSIKLYRTGEGLTRPAFCRILQQAEAGAEALEGLAEFEHIFLDGSGQPSEFDLIALAPRADRAPGIKLYMRPVDCYHDGETLRRLRRWYRCIGQDEAMQQVEKGLAAVAPLDLLEQTRGFFNYLSIDLGPAGVSKTSVYFAPQIVLSYLAQQQPQRLKQIAIQAAKLK